MANSANFEFSKFQRAILVIISIVFIALVWEMAPIHNTLKLAISCVLCGAIFLVVITFFRYLSYFKIITSTRTAVVITMIVFLAFPLAINIVHNVHEKEYLISYPSDKKISVRITYDIDRIGGSGSIGDEWTYKHYLNDREFENGDTLIVNTESAFTITSRFVEQDAISDVGETTSLKYKYASNDHYKKTLVISQKVHVVEQGGRKYAGSTADFNVTYTLKRVVPTSMNYLDMLLYATDSLEYWFSIFLIVGQVLCIVIIVFVLTNGQKKKAIEEEQERIRKEQAFLSEKNTFISSLNGRSIRQVAGVPPCVSFVNGLPKDNNDAQYGSFTVYCSSSGSCYHDKIGCCSAWRPVHYFNAKNRYRPCSKCCTKYRSVPQWYVNYNSLKNQANTYQIDVSE